MVGNDIIDLNEARINSRCNEQRFLDKLFTTEEQAFISKDGCRFQNIWRLWSMKESAYKIVARNFSNALFNPKAFLCKPYSRSQGTVVFENLYISTFTNINPKFIYTVAHMDKRDNIKSHIFEHKLSQCEQRKLLYEGAIEVLADFKSIPVNTISIQKNAIGIPQFHIEDKAQTTYLSLTHHGKFGGFAIMN